MPNDAHRLGRPANRGRRASLDEPYRRHLELVTDGWIAELAEVVVLAAPAGGVAVGARSSVPQSLGRGSLSESAPSSPA
jgi:hypothetical protein